MKDGRCIVEENCLSIDLLAIDQFQDGQSNDEPVKIDHGYIYEVLSGRQNREERATKEKGAAGGDDHPKTPLFVKVRNFKLKDLIL